MKQLKNIGNIYQNLTTKLMSQYYKPLSNLNEPDLVKIVSIGKYDEELKYPAHQFTFIDKIFPKK